MTAVDIQRIAHDVANAAIEMRCRAIQVFAIAHAVEVERFRRKERAAEARHDPVVANRHRRELAEVVRRHRLDRLVDVGFHPRHPVFPVETCALGFRIESPEISTQPRNGQQLMISGRAIDDRAVGRVPCVARSARFRHWPHAVRRYDSRLDHFVGVRMLWRHRRVPRGSAGLPAPALPPPSLGRDHVICKGPFRDLRAGRPTGV
jgi:hypothetical protein